MAGRFEAAEEIPPHAGRMTSALTGLDYTFERAVADVVDNSITAGAKNIWVDIRSDTENSVGPRPYVAITDDGKGMSRPRLVRAMQYGAETEDIQEGLGKFGLGMKTASTSQANVVAVASRKRANGRFNARAWDLDILNAQERWLLLHWNIDDFPSRISPRLQGSSGTTVLWRSLVRALPDERGMSEAELDRAMNEYARETMDHLSLVFNRFLSGNTTGRQRKVSIFVNENALEPIDPLLRDHPETQVLRRKTFVLRRDDGEKATFFMQPAVLPRKDQFVDADGRFDGAAHKRAGGPRGWNAGQGFYMYRLDRLIQGGGWNRLRAADEHSKTARIDVDLTRTSDDLFSLNVSKTRVLIPKAVKDQTREYTAKVVSRAKESYAARYSSKKPRSSASKRANPKATSTSRNTRKHGPKLVLNTLYASCKNQTERATLMKIIGRDYPGFRPPGKR